MIDTNMYTFHWPTRSLVGDYASELIEKLEPKGVTHVWLGSFEALLHNDIGVVNSRLADVCSRDSTVRLIPLGTVNPTLPDWEEDLRRCHEVHKMPGIRLHPNYHGYKLNDPVFARLLAAAAERNLLVQIAARMEDPRTQHRLLTVPDVDLAPLVELLPKYPQLRVQLLNALTGLRPDLLDKLIAAGNLSIEIAMLEGILGIEKLLAHVPLDRVLFGSYFPFYAWESAELKLKESPLGEAQRAAIVRTNAEQLIKGSGVDCG